MENEVVLLILGSCEQGVLRGFNTQLGLHEYSDKHRRRHYRKLTIEIRFLTTRHSGYTMLPFTASFSCMQDSTASPAAPIINKLIPPLVTNPPSATMPRRVQNSRRKWPTGIGNKLQLDIIVQRERLIAPHFICRASLFSLPSLAPGYLIWPCRFISE